MVSGIVTEIFKKVCESTGNKYQELKAGIENGSHQYDKSYRDRHGQLKVFCVGMREPIPLEDVYVAVQFLGKDSASKYGSLEDIEKAFRERDEGFIAPYLDERQDATQVANDKQYLMVLGSPGVGKSTFLRKVGLEALKGKEGNFVHECIPVFLELKRFTGDPIDIETLVTDEFKTCGYPHPEQMVKTALESGQLLILFDGLDEVPTANVDNVVSKIEDFVDRYSQNRFIASCRIAAYKGGFTRFTEAEMAASDDSQIEEYINNWFESTSDPHRRELDQEMKTAQQCWKALNEQQHRATKELARNPLLLTLLCMVYDNSQNFPRNRADLYEKALNIFLEEWAAEKRVRQDASVSQYLDISDEKRMLCKIAATNFEANRLFFSKNELIDQIQKFGEGNANTPRTFNAPKILETIAVDQGLFVERVSRFYSFSHLTFQEYLTANYIVGDTRSIQGLVTDHLHHEEWREVFLMTAGLMREADNLLMQMTDKASKSINTDKLKALFRWAKRITSTPANQYNGTAKRVFAIRQYFALWMLNQIYEDVKNIFNRDRDLKQDYYPYELLGRYYYFDRDLYQDLYPNQYFIRVVHGPRHLGLDVNQALYQGLDQALGLESHFAFDLRFYEDFYRYLGTDFYPLIFSQFGDRFDKELSNRIAVVERMKQAKIFKEADLQRIVRQFNEQRKFINAVRTGESVKPPEESIHDTWLSVLEITDDMLSISHQELQNYVQYLRAVELIVECKEAAGRVSPEIWKQIEDQLLTCDEEDTED